METATVLVCSQIMQVGILGHCLKKMLFRNFKSFHLLEKIIFSDLGQGLPTANGKSGMKWNLWDGIYIDWDRQDIDDKKVKNKKKT